MIEYRNINRETYVKKVTGQFVQNIFNLCAFTHANPALLQSTYCTLKTMHLRIFSTTSKLGLFEYQDPKDQRNQPRLNKRDFDDITKDWKFYLLSFHILYVVKHAKISQSRALVMFEILQVALVVLKLSSRKVRLP